MRGGTVVYVVPCMCVYGVTTTRRGYRGHLGVHPGIPHIPPYEGTSM